MGEKLSGSATIDQVIYRAQRIPLRLNKAQRQYMAKAAGTARVAYNWALAEWKRQAKEWWDSGKVLPYPNALALQKQFNAIKREQFPWITEVSAEVPERAIFAVGVAFEAFRSGVSRYPKFKTRYGRRSFVGSGRPKTVRVGDTGITLPVLGRVRFASRLRWPSAAAISSVVSEVAGKWFVSVVFKLPAPDAAQRAHAAAGVDLGIKTPLVVTAGPVSPIMAEEKVSELLACPLCRSKAECLVDDDATTTVARYGDGGTRYSVQCTNLACRCGQYGWDTPERAAEAWNRRTPTPVTEDVGALSAIAAQAYEDVLSGKLPHRNPFDAVVEAVLSASPSPPKADGPGEVGVKPLEWRELTDDRGDGTREPNGDWEAETPLGIYQIEMIAVGDDLTVWGLTYGIGDEYIGGDHPSPDAAQSAAQSDYEARIRSALVSPSIKREA